MYEGDKMVTYLKLARKYASDLGVEFREFTADELRNFEEVYNRMFILHYQERELIELFQKRKADILAGAMVAAAQFEKRFGGEIPGTGEFGMTYIRAAYLGIGDDWEDAAPFTTGSPQYWIHSGTTLLGGTSGNPIKIGENLVLVIIGIGSLHPSPKIESFYFELDGNPKPIVVTGFPFKLSEIPIKELSRPIILYEDRQFLAKVFISAKYGSSVDDYPYLLGAAFLPEDMLKKHDPADVVKSVNKIVLTT